MGAADTVTKGMQAWEKNDEATISSLVNDDLVLSGLPLNLWGKQSLSAL